MEKTAYKWIMAVIYTVMAYGMYDTRNDYFSFAGVNMGFRYLWAMAILMFSLCVFLVNVDLDRAVYLIKLGALLCLPNLWSIFVSVPLWISRYDAMEIIRRGVFNELYGILTILAMMGMLYVLGEKALWCNLVALLIPNVTELIETVRIYGISEYLTELRTLIVTFADETGPAIAAMEKHELTFALGIYVIFFAVNLREIKWTPEIICLFWATIFIFMSGFKRIGILAVALAIVLFVIMKVLSGNVKRGRILLTWGGMIIIFSMLSYVAMVRLGMLDYLASHFGISLMGRDHLLSVIMEYFDFGPGYTGYGAGFVLELLYGIKRTGLHNDIVSLYVDLGFWGFSFWMAFYFPIKTRFVSLWQDVRGSIMAFVYSIYLLVTALTDNTMHYSFVTGGVALMIMAYHLDHVSSYKKVAEENEKNYENSNDRA